jgi:MazG family protein
MAINPSPLAELVALVAQLRGKDGCPWDQEQSLATMRPYLLEEVYELLEAMEQEPLNDAPNPSDGLEGELGDTLFVLLLITQIASERSAITADSVARRIVNKMIARHPHVFGNDSDDDAPGSIAAWEARKLKKGRSRLDGVPKTMPALLRAHRQGEKAAATGFDWPNVEGVLKKVEEELDELRDAIAQNDPDAIAHELGDVLMSVASVGRHLGAPPEAALRQANDRFARRFSRLERLAEEEGLALNGCTDDDALDRLWERVKAEEATC